MNSSLRELWQAVLEQTTEPSEEGTCRWTKRRRGNGLTVFLGSKITADGDCSHEIKSHLLSGRKSYDQPRQHIKK